MFGDVYDRVDHNFGAIGTIDGLIVYILILLGKKNLTA